MMPNFIIYFLIFIFSFGIYSCSPPAYKSRSLNFDHPQVQNSQPVYLKQIVKVKSVKNSKLNVSDKHTLEPAEADSDYLKKHYYFSGLYNLKESDQLKDPVLSDVKTKRSVLLIVVDAFNASHTSAYGYKRNTTPFLKEFAYKGVTFTNWISNSSWTRPSFTTILTGVSKNIHKMELGQNHLDNGIFTMAESFKKKGYKTAAFIGNPLITAKWNYQQGFELYIDADKTGAFPRASVLVNRAVEWLGTINEKPFFLCIFLTDPHAPYDPPVTGLKYLKGQSAVLPAREVLKPLQKDIYQTLIDAYDDEIAYTDTMIKKLVTFAENRFSTKNLTTVITADHGEIFGQHNSFQHAYHMWEPVVRVPFLIKAESVLEQGVITDIPCTHEDIMPSLLYISGASQKLNRLNKKGLNIFIHNNKNNSFLTRIIITAYDAHGVRRVAARQNNIKLVWYDKVNKQMFSSVGKKELISMYPSLLEEAPVYKLYNIKTDPGELNNIIDKFNNSRQLKILKTAIKKYISKEKITLKKPAKLDSETLEALKAAGYIR